MESMERVVESKVAAAAEERIRVPEVVVERMKSPEVELILRVPAPAISMLFPVPAFSTCKTFPVEEA